MIYDNIGELIGRTPLVRLHLSNPEIKAEIAAKVEFLNPGGSIKDRVGAYMLLDAEKKRCHCSGRDHYRTNQRKHRCGFGFDGSSERL